jgi:hypothetical protein
MTNRFRSRLERSCTPTPPTGHSGAETHSAPMRWSDTLTRLICIPRGHQWTGGHADWLGEDEHAWACARCGLIDTDANLDVLMTGGPGEAPSPQPA